MESSEVIMTQSNILPCVFRYGRCNDSLYWTVQNNSWLPLHLYYTERVLTTS